MESCQVDCYSEHQIHFNEDFSEVNEESVLESQNLLTQIELPGWIHKRLSLQKAVANIKHKLLNSRECTIRDSEQKCLALQQTLGGASLVAVFLQGLNANREEKISMSFYLTQNLAGSNKRPVSLGLVGRNLYLSCSHVGGDPQLSLETVNNIRELKTHELQQYIFIKSENGATSSFESAACPGWYISTSQEENDLVRMMPETDERYFRDFLVFY